MKYHRYLVRIDRTGAHIISRPLKSIRTARKHYPDKDYTILRKARNTDLPF